MYRKVESNPGINAPPILTAITIPGRLIASGIA
jgi:hypothetical protein